MDSLVSTLAWVIAYHSTTGSSLLLRMTKTVDCPCRDYLFGFSLYSIMGSVLTGRAPLLLLAP